jgi:hypothetical protein
VWASTASSVLEGDDELLAQGCGHPVEGGNSRVCVHEILEPADRRPADAGLRVDVRQREPLLLPFSFQELGGSRELNLGGLLLPAKRMRDPGEIGLFWSGSNAVTGRIVSSSTCS